MPFNRDAWEGRKPLLEPAEEQRSVLTDMPLAHAIPGARGIGDVALLEIGCTAYNRSDVEGPDAPEAVGGTIIEIISWPDDDGEVHKAFRTLSIRAGRPNFHVIQEDNVDRSLLEPVNVAHVRQLWRFLCGLIAKSKGVATPGELQLGHWVEVLMSTAAPGQNRRSA